MELTRLIHAIDRLAEAQEQVLLELRYLTGVTLQAKPVIQLDDLIDSFKVKSILDIGNSTLYRLKKSKRVQTARIGKRDYYSKAEITSIIDHFKK